MKSAETTSVPTAVYTATTPLYGKDKAAAMDIRPRDPQLLTDSGTFKAVDRSTLKHTPPGMPSGVAVHTDSSDHNFDTLRKSSSSASSATQGTPPFSSANVVSASPDVNVDADIMASRRKSLSSANQYLREYQDKYGKLGIFRGDDLETAESRMLCFPFFKDNLSRRIPSRRSFIGIDGPDLPGQISTAASWDPSIMDSRFGSRSPVSPLRSTPVCTATDLRNTFDGFDVGRGNIAQSSGHNWNCSVFGGTGNPHGNRHHMGALRESSSIESQTHDHDGSPRDFVKRLAKSNVPVLAQTALRELEASYTKRPLSDPECKFRSSPKVCGDRDNSPLHELTDLARLSRADVAPDGKIDNSIPIINISRDYESNDRTAPGDLNVNSRVRRRAVSDLGFTSREPGIVPTPRTAALLSSPAFKKHLAKNMGISEQDLNEKDFQYDFKLNLPGQSETEVSPGSKVATIGLRERLLRTSVSDSSLNPPSCLNLSSFGALSNSDPSCSSLDKTITDSCGSVVSQSEVRDSFTSPISALNTGFTVSDSLSELSPISASEGGPGKVKFHIPSFREFRQQRTRQLTPRSPAGKEQFNFEFLSRNVIQEENESEISEKVEHLNQHAEQVMNNVDDLDPDSKTLVNALTADLRVGDGHIVEVPDKFLDEPVLVYDPTEEVDLPETVNLIEPPEGFGSKHRGRERKSKRSHKSASRTKSVTSVSEAQQDIVAECHISQDSRGKHRKEPNRKSRTNSKCGDEIRCEGHSDTMFDGHKEVKLIKEFKIRDSSKGHSSDSKIMVVMVKDEAKDAEGQKSKFTDRPPRPERRKRKDEPSKDETYTVQESNVVNVVECSQVAGESPLRRDGSKSRSSRRSSSRSKKHHQDESGNRDPSDVRSQEFDDKVIGGHAGDGFEVKYWSDNVRKQSRRSSRRRFVPKTDAVEEPSVGDAGLSTSMQAEEEEADYKPSDLPAFSSNKLQQIAVENTLVTRSVSDISDMKAEEQRKKGLRERRQKLYKSDPFHGVSRDLPPDNRQGTLDAKTPLPKEDVGCRTSHDQILNLIQDTRVGGATSSSIQSLDSYYDDLSSECAGSSVGTPSPGTPSPGTPSPGTPSPGTPILFRHFPKYSLYPPLSPLWGRKCRSEDGPSGAEVERVDSGVGAELKDSSSSKEFKGGPICEDCEGDLTTDNMSSDSDFLCRKCESRRVERKETIQEIVDTEVSYGKDLKIIKEEFYLPMQTAGLLNADQLQTVFSNLEELITINDRFCDQLLDGLELANEQGDEDYSTVHVGHLFLEASNMLLAFETYCVNQASVPVLLEKLEVEKELLRIFLHVSQTDNSLLRRMNLRSFLMVPVQRVMKYPLLLGRLHKATALHHEDRDSIRRAQGRVEDILEHINSQSRGGNNATMRLRRKISGLSVIKKTGSADDIEINKMAIEVLGWNRKDVNFVMSGRIQFTQPADHLWMKKGRSLKFLPAYALLLTLGRSTGERWTGRLLFTKSSGIQDAALVLIKEKAGKFVPLRDPLKLERCVVSVDPEYDEVFEIMDSNKESFLFKGEDRKDTQTWLQHLKLQTKDLGSWRKRRNALPNIMIHSNKS